MRAPSQRALAAIAVLATVLMGCRGDHRTARRELLVGAAVSLGEMLQEAARQYEAAHHTAIRLNLAASNVLARQIQEGAPMDVFISADDAQMDAVGQQIATGTRVPLYGNALVVMVRDGWTAPMRTLDDLEAPAVTRIAIGDPTAVPAGVYAKRLLVRTGRWERVQDRLVPSGSVRAALSAVDSGHADAAIVYRTDVRAARHARRAFEVTGSDTPRIVYPAAALARTAHLEEARAWLAWLQGPEGRAIAARYEFAPPPAP
jgi:molybdate transport system substrate-binding protein